jgi:hypothetical protein
VKILSGNNQLPKALAAGIVRIGDRDLACAVLDDENNTRVFTQQGFLLAIGRARAAKGGEGASVDGLPAFLRAKNLKPFISKDLMESTSPIIFESQKNKGRAFGYKATLLSKVCWVYHDAAMNGKLTSSQKHIADLCEVMLRALTNVAIDALIDEATGFQEVRAKDALHRLLAAYISEELLPWAKRFPDEFYHEIYRLKGWKFNLTSAKRPMYVGKLTNQIVYEKLPPGVLDELKHKNPPDEKGRRRFKHHQFLTEDIGNPHLERHIISVMALMRAAVLWPGFMRLFDRVFPSGNFQQEELFDEK